ncbi:MAG TPA: PEP-CTERM sorting domain-containing protein [Phycisphaerae bacterium]|nr:PEP-CTERM sorting domain-containing protein [Phycisphaerae bacterium]HUT57391.1 PEP-CTERM sorting domain-containing protein [Phycisphaerae bacterium]
MRSFPMSMLIVVVCVGFAGVGVSKADYDPNGVYWDGLIGRDVSDALFSQLGTNTITMTGPTTGAFYWVGDNSDGDVSLVVAGTIPSLTFDANQWAYMTSYFAGDPNFAMHQVLALTSNTYVSVGRDANAPPGLSLNLGMRKAPNQYDANDLVGTWAYLNHRFTDTSAELSYGTVQMSGPDGNGIYTFQTDFYQGDGTPDDNSWGTLSYNSTASLLDITVIDPNIPLVLSTFSIPIGVGKMGFRMDFADYVLDANNSMGVELIVKLGTGRTLSEVTGDWLYQGLACSARADFGTEWGELHVDADGNFVISLHFSDSNDEASVGWVTVADDGNVAFWGIEDGNQVLYGQGYLNLDGDLVVLGLYDDAGNDDIFMGTSYLSRAVPEPAAMAALAAGAAWFIRRRRKTR